MISYLCNAFNDPSDPWYYVIGVIFLLLIFGALVAYMVLSKKNTKNNGETPDVPTKSKTEVSQNVQPAETPEEKNDRE